MKTFRVLLVSVISFCLLNVQMVMTTQGLRVTTNTAYADACPEVDGDQPAGTDCSQLAGGVNSQNFQSTQTYNQQQGSTEEHGLIEQLMMLAIGFIVAGWFTTCMQPLPMDMIIAAVGAGILIIGEIVAISMYQGTAAEMEMAYQADHEGKMLNNDDQVEAFRKELDNNENIKEALETKLALQIAAEVVFIAALALAITIAITWYTVGAVCIAGSALAICPGPCQVQCSATAAQAAQMFAKAEVPKESVSEKTTSEVESGTVQSCPACIGFGQISRWFYAGCFPVASTIDNPNNFAGGLYAIIEKKRPEMSHIAKTVAKDFNDYHMNPTPEKEKEAMQEAALEIIAENGVGNWTTNEFTKHKLNKFPNFNIETEEEIDYYIKKYEWNQYLNGSITSISVDDYNYFKDLYDYKNIEGEAHFQIRDFLVMAADKGLDIFVPKAEANFGKLLTLLGGALMGYLLAGSTVMKLLLGTATRRAIVYGIFGGIVGAGIAATNEDIDAVDSNIDKLNEIINNLSNLNSGPMVTHTGAPDTGGGANGIDRPQVNPQDGTIDLSLEDNKPTPCLGGGTPGNCNSVQDQYKAANAIEGLTLDSSLNSTASTAAGIGDDISGTKSLNSGTLGKIKGLSKNKGALSKLRDRLKDRLNKDRKKSKLGGIDFDKESAKWKDKMQAAILKKIKDDGKTPGQVLAASGIPTLNSGKDKNKKDDKALKDAKAALAAAKGKAVAGKGKTKAPKIGFDFGDNKAGIGGGDGAGLDDPNTIGEDEEYVLDDIVEDKGASLWQIISVRYLKSGYNRLSGDKKAAPAKISE